MVSCVSEMIGLLVSILGVPWPQETFRMVNMTKSNLSINKPFLSKMPVVEKEKHIIKFLNHLFRSLNV